MTATSADTAGVGLGTLTTTRPRIVGLPTVGKKLTAVSGLWPAGTRLSYAWLANGKAITHATAKRLTLTKARRGQRISVTITGTHPGYRTRTVTSARTARIG